MRMTRNSRSTFLVGVWLVLLWTAHLCNNNSNRNSAVNAFQPPLILTNRDVAAKLIIATRMSTTCLNANNNKNNNSSPPQLFRTTNNRNNKNKSGAAAAASLSVPSEWAAEEEDEQEEAENDKGMAKAAATASSSSSSTTTPSKLQRSSMSLVGAPMRDMEPLDVRPRLVKRALRNSAQRVASKIMKPSTSTIMLVKSWFRRSTSRKGNDEADESTVLSATASASDIAGNDDNTSNTVLQPTVQDDPSNLPVSAGELDFVLASLASQEGAAVKHKVAPMSQSQTQSSTTSTTSTTTAAVVESASSSVDDAGNNIVNAATATAITITQEEEKVKPASGVVETKKEELSTPRSTSTWFSKYNNQNNNNNIEKANGSAKESTEQDDLAAQKYQSIDSLEERAYTILKDLGMVEPSLDFHI